MKAENVDLLSNLKSKALSLKELKRVPVFLLLLFSPTQLGLHFWPPSAFIFGIRVDYLSPTVYLTDILILLIVIVWAVENKKLGLKFRLPTLLLFFCLYLLITSLLIAPNHSAALYKLGKFIEFSLLFLIVKNSPWIKRLLPLTLSVSLIYISLLGIWQFFLQHSIGGLFWFLGERSFSLSTPGIAKENLDGLILRPYSTFSHPNSFAGFVLVCLILLCPWKPRIAKAAFILGIASLVLTFSQSTWVVAAFVLVLTFLLRATQKKNLWIGIIVLFTLFSVLPFVPGWGQQEELTNRKLLLEAAGTVVLNHPFFGVGLNNFLIVSTNFLALPQISWLLQPVHNIFLLYLAETGLVGLLFLIFFFYKLQKNLVSNNTLSLALAAILLTGSLDHYWLTLQQNQLLFSVVLALLYSANSGKLEKDV